MPELSSYTSVKTHLYVRLQIDEYRTTSSGSYTPQILTFSDDESSFTINSETYTPLGRFLTVTASTSDLRTTTNTCTISLSGIPANAIEEILYSKVKGAPIAIYRAYFDVSTGTQIGDTVGRFIGSVNNYSLEEDFDIESRTASNILQLECASNIGILETKIAGRKTNPQSMKSFFDSDTSMDRVPTLKEKIFNFGAPS
jgi:hypothetical protein